MSIGLRGMKVSHLAREALRSGTLAAVVMMPFGLAFRALGLRVNEYGMKTIAALFGAVSPRAGFALFVVEHFLIAWTAAVPLLLALRLAPEKFPPLLVGAAYGAGFYGVVNSLALPWLFGDPTPWQLGFAVVAPSLTVHLAYGISIAVTAQGFSESGTSPASHPTIPM